MLSVLEVETLLRKCDIRVRDEEETTPKYLERLANALDTMSPCLVATIHCLGTAFAMVSLSKVKSADVTSATIPPQIQADLIVELVADKSADYSRSTKHQYSSGYHAKI